MSIKTISKEIKGSEGIAKRINKGAEKMVFDILQSTQYSTPIPSTVRELVTNACDSQREKEIAIEILKGEKKIEDYYIKRHGEAYEDSNFDPNYYDLNYLDQYNNKVDVLYEQRPGVGFCDTFAVIDYGVGIGQRRLEGVLELGYSTKRNTAENFGAFGLGAKVALSTGIDFYTIETIHNGMRFKCNCYNYKTDFIIPKFGKDGINPHITFSDGTKVYYEKTNKQNFTKISFGVKKHNRSKFFDSVEEQLIYLDNVNCKRIEYCEDGSIDREEDIDFKAEVLHNSENLIISDSWVFNRPHIVVVREKGANTGINYGHIDFRELEMESLWGAIAFKCPIRQSMTDPDTNEEIIIQDGVDVTPSREKVIWNEKTKAYVQGVIKRAANEASKIIEEQLQESDYIKWIHACTQVLHDADSNSTLGRLSKIIDKTEIKPKFPGNKKLSFQAPKTVFKHLEVKHIVEAYDYKERKDKIERNDLDKWGNWNPEAIYLKSQIISFNKYKDMYLLEQHGGKVVVINDTMDDDIPDAITKMQDGQGKQQAIGLFKNSLNKSKLVLDAIKASPELKSYDDVEVPEEWIEARKASIAEKEEIAKFDNLSPMERREIEKRMVAYTLRYEERQERYVWDKIEPRTKDLMSTERITYYGTKEDEAQLKFAAMTLFWQAPTQRDFYQEQGEDDRGWRPYDHIKHEPVFFYDQAPVRFMKTWGSENGTYEVWAQTKNLRNEDITLPQLIRLSAKSVKFVKQNSNCKHISEYFLQLNDKNEYTMDTHLIRWYTARKLDEIREYRFMTGLKGIHPELFEKFKNCFEIRDEHYNQKYERSNQLTSDEYHGIISQIDKLDEFQRFCKETDDENLIAQKSRELFVLDIPGSEATIQSVIDDYEEIQEFGETLQPLLNAIPTVQDDPDVTPDVTPELEKELRIYLEAKDRLKWEK